MPVSTPFRDDVDCADVAQTVITGQSLTVTVWQGLQHHLALRRAASHGACTASGLAGGPDGTPFSTEQQLLVEIRGSGSWHAVHQQCMQVFCTAASRPSMCPPCVCRILSSSV